MAFFVDVFIFNVFFLSLTDARDAMNVSQNRVYIDLRCVVLQSVGTTRSLSSMAIGISIYTLYIPFWVWILSNIAQMSNQDTCVINVILMIADDIMMPWNTVFSSHFIPMATSTVWNHLFQLETDLYCYFCKRAKSLTINFSRWEMVLAKITFPWHGLHLRVTNSLHLWKWQMPRNRHMGKRWTVRIYVCIDNEGNE